MTKKTAVLIDEMNASATRFSINSKSTVKREASI